MTLLDMVRNYQSLLERKDALAEETKKNNAAIEAAKETISQQMVDDDVPSISTGGYKFSLQEKTIFSKKSEADIAHTGTTFFDVLREEGLGDIIVEQVNACQRQCDFVIFRRTGNVRKWRIKVCSL